MNLNLLDDSVFSTVLLFLDINEIKMLCNTNIKEKILRPIKLPGLLFPCAIVLDK